MHLDLWASQYASVLIDIHRYLTPSLDVVDKLAMSRRNFQDCGITLHIALKPILAQRLPETIAFLFFILETIPV